MKKIIVSMVVLFFSSMVGFSQNQKNVGTGNGEILGNDGLPIKENKDNSISENQKLYTTTVDLNKVGLDGTPLKANETAVVENLNQNVTIVDLKSVNPDGTPIGSKQVEVKTETPQLPVVETYVRKTGAANLDVPINVQETYIRKSDQSVAPFDESREKYVRDASIQEPRPASVSKLQSSDKTVSGTVETNQDLLAAPTVKAAPVSATLKKSEVTVSGSVETNKDLLVAPKVTPTAPAANLKSSSNTAAGLEEKTK